MIKLSLLKNRLTISGRLNEQFFLDPIADVILVSTLKFQKWETEKNRFYAGIVTDDDLEYILEELEDHKVKYKKNDELDSRIETRKKKKEEFQKIIKQGKKIKTSKKFSVNPKKFSSRFRGFYKFQKPTIQHTVDIAHTANFSVPGAGKTIMSYAAYTHLKEQGIVDQLWVIGPKPSFQPWEDEYEKLFGKSSEKNVIRYAGTRTQRIILLPKLQSADVVLLSFGLAGRDWQRLQRQWAKNMKKIFLIIDEAHHIKTIKMTTGGGELTTAAAVIELGKGATKRCILTGTPLPHDWYDLWSQFTFLYPDGEVFGTRNEFENLLLDPDADEIISKKIQSLWSRVTINELKKQLPKAREKMEPVKMDKLQQDVYDLIIQQIQLMDEGPEKEKAAEWRAAKIIRLLQAVTNPRLMIEDDATFDLKRLKGTEENVEILKKIAKLSEKEISPKLVKAAKIAEDLINGKGKYSENSKRNVLIYTLFRGNGKLLEKLLQKYNPLVVSGEISIEGREDRILEFKNWDPGKESHGKILIATLGSIAEAVSLHMHKGRTVCRDVIYLERSYNAGQYMQSLYRVYRIGSLKTKNITYHVLESKTTDGGNTIDSDIDSTLSHRTKRMNELLNDKMNLSRISLGEDYDANDDKSIMYSFEEGDDLGDILKRVQKLTKKKNR